MFLPTTKEEMKALGWNVLDIVLITGDTYIDSSFVGATVIGKALVKEGFRVGIIAQPDINTPADITRLGEPLLYWGVTGGCVDSMVANYTASKKHRRSDDFTPGGINNRRPDRAVMTYTNLIRRNFKYTQPIVIGGLEASLRRIAHYDYWDDKIRRSILFDAKADILIYGMGEKASIELARRMEARQDYIDVRGICYISKTAPEGYLELPSFEEAASDKTKFTGMFQLFYRNNEFATAKGLYQKHAERYLVQNPPAKPLTETELDAIHALDYERDVHPFYKKDGEVKAMETIRFSITTHRGCYGECNFCSIAVHQGRDIINRSEASIIQEAAGMIKTPGFKGYILDVGGPTANMYGIDCGKIEVAGARGKSIGRCADKRCVYPSPCPSLKLSHQKQIHLLKELRKLPGLKKAFVASGVRYDMVIGDGDYGAEYIRELAEHHISGQMKVAPEHSEGRVLELMGKPGIKPLLEFKKAFHNANRRAGKPQFLTYYFIAAHPGCGMEDMEGLQRFVSSELHIHPEQVQIFMPTPSTYSTLMYYTGKDPFTSKELFVERGQKGKEEQKNSIVRM